MLTVAHFSKADSVKGQGVGSAYLELIRLQKTRLKNQLTIKINDYAPSDISHYHTINPQYFLTSFSHASSSPALARCTNKESVLYSIRKFASLCFLNNITILL